MHKLKRGDIKNWTDQNSYHRGRLYFEQGQVSHLHVEELNRNEIILHAAVQGRNKAPYRQEIYIGGLATGAIEIDGDCSCPVGFNCKHVVAACLKYQSGPETENNSAALSLSWLDKFAQAGQPENSLDSASNNFIVYILNSSNVPSELSVQFMSTRKLKKGGLGKGRRTELYHLINSYSSAAGQNSDREIGKLIETQNEHIWGPSRTYTLSGELGFLALSKMLNTGRCFWQDIHQPPLQTGEPRKLQINWRKEKNGDRRLVLQVEPEAVILNTSPVLYIDAQATVMGLVEGANFTPEQWTLLLQAPLVAASDCAEFSQHLLTRLTDIPLPPPQKMETLTIEQQSSVARLYLFADQDSATGQRMHMMRLRFAYAEYELTYSPATPVRKLVKNNLIISIERDLPAENAAIEILVAAGFQLIQDKQENDLIFSSSTETELMGSAEIWQHFLDEILPQLEIDGWEVEFDPDFKLRFLQIDDWGVEIESNNDWFDLRFDLDVEGQKLPLLPLISEVLTRYEPDNLPEILTLPLGDSQYLQLPSERIRPICQVLYELYDTDTLDSDGTMRMSRFDATRLAELEENCDSELRWRGGKALRELGRKLKNFKGIRTVATPRGLKASLRDYQQQGLNWLQFLRNYEFNGILADDMGLGKTVQALAHLLLEKERKRMDKPCLILAPTSLMSNWRREAQKFTPKLRVLVLQGSERRQYFADISKYDLILSTYPLLVRDHETLLAQEYHYLILDEAQVIKNPRAKAARLAREISARHRLCLTGTPMENHLGELWALFDFLMPGFLGDSKLFTQRFRNPIEKYGDSEQRQRLVRRVSPFLLRRTKTEVVKELPQKTEIIRSVELNGKQAALYESIRLSMEKKVRDAINKKGLARSHITILDALLKLRQICCDPQLLSLAQAKKVKVSAKLEMLMQMLPELLEEGRRILLFSQFTKMLGIIEARLKEENISYTKLTGQTRKRDQVIERFRQGEVDVFLISLKAGGVGLNLTEADTVIHYDPWWNPAVENQATDRAHRIGQNKAVFVYKLITENTLEEKIMAMQARKQALADGVYKEGRQGKDLKLNADDLQELLAPLSE